MRHTGTLTFCGGAKNPTGSNFLLELAGKNILVDCGFYQGEKIDEDINRSEFPYDPKDIDVLLVTHAHLDHIGRIPKLIKEGFKGKIYSTAPTKDISKLMLVDSMRVLEKEAKRHGYYPSYERSDITKILRKWKTVEYEEELDLSDDIAVKLYDAGHILGSAIVAITHNGSTIAFTGDLGNTPAPLLNDTVIAPSVRYLVMESVYGDRNHEDREGRREMLRYIVSKTIARKGVVMIPTFSIERTQEVLYELNHLIEQEDMDPVPVFLDSPLAIGVTKVYSKYRDTFNEHARLHEKLGDDIFDFPLLRFTKDHHASRAIKEIEAPKIILAGSGMSNGGRIRGHEREYLPDAKNTLLLVGYQAVGTLGRLLQDGAREVDIDGEMITVRAEVVNIRGYSAHKDSEGLLDFVEETAEQGNVERVFVVLGEPKSSLHLVQKIRDYLDIDAITPNDLETIELSFD
jgi:metallo-beta-lactamase family protein